MKREILLKEAAFWDVMPKAAKDRPVTLCHK